MVSLDLFSLEYLAEQYYTLPQLLNVAHCPNIQMQQFALRLNTEPEVLLVFLLAKKLSCLFNIPADLLGKLFDSGEGYFITQA